MVSRRIISRLTHTANVDATARAPSRRLQAILSRQRAARLQVPPRRHLLYALLAASGRSPYRSRLRGTFARFSMSRGETFGVFRDIAPAVAPLVPVRIPLPSTGPPPCASGMRREPS